MERPRKWSRAAANAAGDSLRPSPIERRAATHGPGWRVVERSLFCHGSRRQATRNVSASGVAAPHGAIGRRLVARSGRRGRVGNCGNAVCASECSDGRARNRWPGDRTSRRPMRLLVDAAMPCYDDAVIGAGILGLAHAYHLARRGRQVVVLERRSGGHGRLGPEFRDALAGRSALRRAARPRPAEPGALAGGAGVGRTLAPADRDRCTSPIARTRPGSSRNSSPRAADRGEPFEWLEPVRGAVILPRRVRPDGLLGAIWSPEEVCVDPREVVAGLPAWLGRHHGVAFRFDDAGHRRADRAASRRRSGRLEVGAGLGLLGRRDARPLPRLLARAGWSAASSR